MGGGQGEDVWSIKFDNVHIQLRIIIKLPVNILLSIRRFRSPSKASSLINRSPKHMGFMRIYIPCLFRVGYYWVHQKTLRRLSPQSSHSKTPLQEQFDGE